MKKLVNPRAESVRLTLSDGSERLVPAWGIAVLPDQGLDGQPINVIRSEVLPTSAAHEETKPSRAA